MKIEKAVHKIKKKSGVGREREEERQKGGRQREGWKERERLSVGMGPQMPELPRGSCLRRGGKPGTAE